MAAHHAAASDAGEVFNNPALTVGLISEHHHAEQSYDETNPGLCLESGFHWYVTGCLFEDSHSKPAGLLAAGGRLSITDWLHIGAGFGLRFRQAINEETGQEYVDPDPAAAVTLTLGTEKLAAHFIRTPETETKHDTIPAVTWLQVRIGFDIQ